MLPLAKHLLIFPNKGSTANITDQEALGMCSYFFLGGGGGDCMEVLGGFFWGGGGAGLHGSIC